MHGSPDPTHLVRSYCNPFIALLSHNNFMHVSRKVVSIDGSISGSSLSLLPEVEASVKLFLASTNVSFARSKSNSSSFVGALRTQALSSGYLALSSPLQSTMFTCSELVVVGVFLYRATSLSMWGSPLSHDQTGYNINMILSSDLYNCRHNALALCNCNKSVICGPFLVPFHLFLICAPEIQCTPSLPFNRGLTFMSELCR